MKNNNQQLLNNNQLNGMIPRKTEEEIIDLNNKTIFRDQWNFLDNYGSLFRKSSLILIVTLGRDYTNKFHVRDLSRMLQYDVSLISKNLKKLESFGLVKREDIGNLVFYQANMNSVLLRHIKICFTLMELNELLHTMEPVSTGSILYGSCAQGDDTSASDIDLFIETTDKDTANKIINSYQNNIIRTLSPVIVTPDEMYKIKMNDRTFYSAVQQGIILKRGENVI